MVLNRFMPAMTAPFAHEPSCALEAVAMNHSGNGFHKWHHYMAVYDRYLAQFRGKPITVLEIGVDGGGSLQLWQTYFGERARVHGADINPKCEAYRSQGLNIHIGDQSDPLFLQQLIDELAPFDVVIDDGSHIGAHQILGFETLFPHIKDGGVYICEDLHASYWPSYFNGINNTNRFTDYLKMMIDRQHKWFFPEQEEAPDDFVTRTVAGIHLYDSIVVIEKAINHKPMPIGYGEIGLMRIAQAHPQKSLNIT